MGIVMPEATKPPGPEKPIHTIVLDAGPLIKNVPTISTLLGQSHELVTTPSVLSEIRDADGRRRIETIYMPFVTQRTPRPNSLSFVAEFAKKSGDRAVLSRTDLEVIALAYEIECERNGGDWRLRNAPGQKGTNGAPPTKIQEGEDKETQGGKGETDEDDGARNQEGGATDDSVAAVAAELGATTLGEQEDTTGGSPGPGAGAVEENAMAGDSGEQEAEHSDDEETNESDPDGGEWITPSNIKKRQAKDAATAGPAPSEPQTMQVATITTDFAMQNVLLQINLTLLSTSTLQRIRHLKSHILRCHGCFSTTRDMNKQFCPRCGQPNLTRVSCSTSANGQFRMHLKKNMQWNNRGNRYSVPKPVTGQASGKRKGKGGGKGGWGTELILAEDQKEYTRAVSDEQRRRKGERDLMDQDYLPAILSGDRNKGGGGVKVGAGRSVNSRRRR